METNKKLQLQTFVNDTYDVLAGNSDYCSQEEYRKRYAHNEWTDSCFLITHGSCALLYIVLMKVFSPWERDRLQA